MSTLWKIYRWKLFFAATLLHMLLYLAGLFLSFYSHDAYETFYGYSRIYSLLLNFFIIISVAQMLQYWGEPARITSIVYIYAFAITIMALVALKGSTLFISFSAALLLILYSTFCLLGVKAPEVSTRFKSIAGYNILSAVLTFCRLLFPGTHSLFHSLNFYLLHSIVIFCPYVLILLILYKMMHLPEYYSQLQKEIDSIGEMV